MAVLALVSVSELPALVGDGLGVLVVDELLDPVVAPEAVGAGAAELALETLFAFTTVPPCTLPTELDEEVPAAADWYAAMVSPVAGGLTTPAMPPWQCVGVEQKYQIGSVLVTLTSKTSELLIEPESNPVLDREPIEHGELKSPWTAVWMLPTKWNTSVSPTSAVVESGVKTNPP